MTRVHVLGAAGYAAAEAIGILHAHPGVELGVLESRTLAGERLGEHFAFLRRLPQRCAGAGSVMRELRAGEFVVAAGSDDESRAAVPPLLARGARVVDLSAAFRDGADGAVYGLSEWRREAIAGAALVANPGCYPTAALLALLPLAGLPGLRHVAIDAKSGITGAGRTPKTGSLFAEVSGEIRPYALEGHRHQPEMEAALAAWGMRAPLTFTPQVVPLARGLLAGVYAFFATPPEPAAVRAAYRRAYAESPFVRLLDGAQAPSVAAVAGSNDAELRVDVAGALVRVLCAIDNLGKGAAGQAVQNLNIMLGLPETSGLHGRLVVA